MTAPCYRLEVSGDAFQNVVAFECPGLMHPQLAGDARRCVRGFVEDGVGGRFKPETDR